MVFVNEVMPQSPAIVVYADFGVRDASYSRRRQRRNKTRR